MIIEFDLIGRDSEAAFFALYAGLRMYKEQKQKDTPQGQMSIPAAEAYCMLMDLKKDYPDEYEIAEQDFDDIYNRG